MNALVERLHASSGVEIQILKLDVLRAHRASDSPANALDTTKTHPVNMAAAPATLLD